MDRITELLGRLADLTADELAELAGLIADEAENLANGERTAETVQALTELAEASDQVRAEETRREEVQAELDTRAEEALARIAPPADDTTDDQTAEGDTPADDAIGETAPEVEQEAVAASAAAAARRPALSRLANRRPAGNNPAHRTTDTPTSRTTITADGQELTTRRQMAETMSRRIEQNRGVRGQGRLSVIRAVTEFPTERRLGADGPQNQALVAAALDGDALAYPSLVAAGGLCAPIENLYDVRVVGTAARPVRDALVPFGADRGGVSLRSSPVFSDWAGALGTWTLADDEEAGDPESEDPPTKPVIDALCPSFEDFFVDALTTRVRFRNVTARFDPEGTQANLDALDIAHARRAENFLLAKIDAQCLAVTVAKQLGAARDVLYAFDASLAYYRNRHRLDDNTAFRAILPRWLKDMLRIDIARGHRDLEAMALADAQINAWFSARNVTVTWHLDGNPSAESNPTVAAQQYAAAVNNTAVPEFPDQVAMRLYPEGDFLLLDGGELDLGLVRDSTLNASNAYELFKEEFVGVAYRGIEALKVVATVDPNGLSAGTKDTTSLSD